MSKATKEEAFLAEIIAHPADPTPRLIFADWLDERGDPRGELIRVQEQLRAWGAQTPQERAATEKRLCELLYDEGVPPIGPFIVNSIGMKLAMIPPGEFLMGSPESELDRGEDETQVHVQLTQPFWLGVYPVTQAEWRQVMGSEPWEGQESVHEDPACPATYVSWNDATEFCRKLTEQERQAGWLPEGWQYALPTEAQWEHACRAGTTTRYSFGDDHSQFGDYGWFYENALCVGEKYAHLVGQKHANPCGLYDMHGNVCEWCRDLYQEKLPGGADPETTMGSCRVYRGGNWCYSVWICESSFHYRKIPTDRDFDLGFRLAQVLCGQ